ncbi:MAG TPA: DUF1778 domain-containing protein [Mycobacteriales bacterium]|nr:DUF1778 domain-containing protein [Mycobacteriales bacterium]
MAQSARFEFRVQAEIKARIEAAAALEHESASDFARTAAIERADGVLRRSEATVVPPDFFDALLDALDAPIERNARLTAAARRARAVLHQVPST